MFTPEVPQRFGMPPPPHVSPAAVQVPQLRMPPQPSATGPQLAFSPTQVKFGYAKSEALPAYCRRCEFLADCWGECPKNRMLRTPDGEPGLNYLCRGLKHFFAHAGPRASRMAAELRAAPQSARPRI